MERISLGSGRCGKGQEVLIGSVCSWGHPKGEGGAVLATSPPPAAPHPSQGAASLALFAEGIIEANFLAEKRERSSKRMQSCCQGYIRDLLPCSAILMWTLGCFSALLWHCQSALNVARVILIYHICSSLALLPYCTNFPSSHVCWEGKPHMLSSVPLFPVSSAQ